MRRILVLSVLMAAAGVVQAAPPEVINKYACLGCHAEADKKVGPAYKEVAAKYKGRADAEAYLVGKIKAGGKGVWGPIMMPPQQVSDADAKVLAKYILSVK